MSNINIQDASIPGEKKKEKKKALQLILQLVQLISCLKYRRRFKIRERDVNK